MFPPQWRFTCATSSSSEQALRNLVNRSVQRITEVYRVIDQKLKSANKKELLQKKMASNRQEREDTQEDIHVTLEQY